MASVSLLVRLHLRYKPTYVIAVKAGKSSARRPRGIIVAVNFYASALIGFFLGFAFGVGCALAVMYSIYRGGYRAAVRDAARAAARDGGAGAKV